MMKKRLSVALVCMAIAFQGVFGQTISVKSPDGKNEIRLMTEPMLSYAVYREGVERVSSTPLALEIEGGDMLGGAGMRIVRTDAVELKGSVPTPIYKKSVVDESENMTVVTFMGCWKVMLAARDDGVAYRFATVFPDDIKVKDEVAGVTFPDSVAAIYAGYGNDKRGDPLQCSWQSIYVTTDTIGIAAKGETVYLPLVVKYKDGAVMCVTESDLLDYPGWNMKRADGEKLALESCMARYPLKVRNTDHFDETVPEERPLRYRHVTERADYIAKTVGTRTYPWRVFMLASTEAKLCEADIVYALAMPCKLTDTDWIKPGKVAWDWWNDWNVSDVPFKAGCNTATYEYYIDFAAKFGIEYVIMDEGWSKHLDVMEINPDTDVPHLVEYANVRDVGIILWCAWPQLVGRQNEVFSKYAKMGVKGFKIDFMNRDDQVMERFLEETARIAADWKLVLDYHGMHKPTGLSRAYPNVLNYEGVHGLEEVKWEDGSDFPRSDLMSFYCRQSAGPMDYTPGAMQNMTKTQFRSNYSNPGSQGTRVHQMALMTLCEAPLQMLCDSPTQYLRNMECFEFMAKVPAVWDETVGLCGAMEDYAAVARRKGDVWYVSAIGSWQPQKIKIDTSFLGKGKWQANIFADGINADRNAADYVHKTDAITAGDNMVAELGPGGGWTVRFVRDATSCNGDSE